MRLPPTRLNGFTILELLVALLVSALLFNLAYAALGLVQRQQRVLQYKASTLEQVSTLQTLLAADFARSTRIEASATSVECSEPRQVVRYEWLDSAIVRHQSGLIDTFPLPPRQVTGYFQAQPQTAGLIDELTLEVTTRTDTFHLQAAARFSASDLLAYPAQP